MTAIRKRCLVLRMFREVRNDPDVVLRSDRGIPLVCGLFAGSMAVFCAVFVHDVIDTSYFVWKIRPWYDRDQSWWSYFYDSFDFNFAIGGLIVFVLTSPVFFSNAWRMGVVWEVHRPVNNSVMVSRSVWGKRESTEVPTASIGVGYGNALRTFYRAGSYGRNADVVAEVGEMTCLIDYNCADRDAIERANHIAGVLGVEVQEHVWFRCSLPFFMFN